VLQSGHRREQHGGLFKGGTLSGASWVRELCPGPIAPTHGHAALMILRRYCT
jgi:hypothetical protein